MFTITFQRSKSKYFQKALNHAKRHGATWNGETVTLRIQDYDLTAAYETHQDLLKYITKWKGTKGEFNGRKVRPFPFLLRLWQTVHQCKNGFLETNSPRYCWSGIDIKGWGCKHINKTHRYVRGSGKYRTSNLYWYNYGEFTSPNMWKVNKEMITRKIQDEVEEKGLNLCPFFSIEEIRKAIGSLPEFIHVDGSEFVHYKVPEYVDGEKALVAVNIRHVERPRQARIQDLMVRGLGRHLLN